MPKANELAQIKVAVIGLGRSGCSIVASLPDHLDKTVDRLYIQTHNGYFKDIDKPNNISIETEDTKEFGTNGEAYLGERCAEKHKNKLLETLSTYNIVFIIAGLGGGTGSGATPYLAKILKDAGVLSISIISLPFQFEGSRKKRVALSSYQKIKSCSDTTVIIDNNEILNSKVIATNSLFSITNEYMLSAINGLLGLITRPGLINVDISDLKTALKGMSVSTIGVGIASGEQRASIATKQAIRDTQTFFKSNISECKSLIISISAGLDMGIHEFEEIGSEIKVLADPNATVIVGTTIDPELQGEIKVLITASGHDDNLVVEELPNNEIFRSIVFEPEHIQSGISILSYFGEVLQQRYANIEAKIRIERSDKLVTLVIESESQVIERIEQSLDIYGDIVTGKLPASALLSDRCDIERLQMKLEMSAMEIRHNQNIIDLYKRDKEVTESRVNTLEKQVKKLHRMLGGAIKGSYKLTGSSLSLAQNNISLLELYLSKIEDTLSQQPSEKSNNELITNIKQIEKHDSSALKKVQDLFINSLYGITGNIAYDFLIKVISAIPK